MFGRNFTVCCAAGWLLAFWITSADAGSVTLAERLLPLIEKHDGQVRVAVKHLKTGEVFEHESDVVVPTASLIKIAVMVEAYAQAEEKKCDLLAKVELRDDAKVAGSGILTPHFSAGTTLSVRDLVRLMIAFSDNTATNLVLDQIGIEAVNARMAREKWNETRINSRVFRGDSSVDPERSRQYGLGTTTAAETVSLLERLHRGELVSKAASEEMLDHLRACQDRTMLVRFLPENVRVAHKTGSVSASRCDAGLMETDSGTIAVAVLTHQNKDRRWNEQNEACVLMGRIGREVFQHFNDAWVDPQFEQLDVLKSGDSGELVEALQRTLNERLKPSPKLSVDGDFGAQTAAAVTRFQREKKLPATGEVDEVFWKELGALATVPTVVPPPEPRADSDLEPADALDGPPLVTSRTWVIGDGQTGRILWGSKQEDPVEIASTTKIMTAWLVLRLAERQPQVLEETVTFSRRADRTIGSTSGVHAGEKVRVSELLHGLMLPSGNDAAVALAEHFGARVSAKPTEKKSSKSDPLVDFVAEMNHAASELEMRDTKYKNPHGLPEKGHVSSARDLLRLTFEAWRLERFRQLVTTREFVGKVAGPGGYRREIEWKNSNELLGITGYEGIKTGTTDAAGACLVSTGLRGADRLFVVTLGASSSKARYTDTRNLFRWAWQQRGAK